MKIAITQPNFFPWAGYFDLLDTVDNIVFLDNVMLSPRSFMIRNRMKDNKCIPFWISESIRDKSQNRNIREHYIFKSNKWIVSLSNKIMEHYNKARYCDDLLDILNKTQHIKETRLSCFNVEIILNIANYLGININYDFSSNFISGNVENVQDKILAICKKQSATQYYNFRNGIEAGLYSPEAFKDEDIELLKQEYTHPLYNQLGEKFVPYLSILDLIANEGKMSLDILRVGRKWISLN